MRRREAAGFSTLELMAVLAIAILMLLVITAKIRNLNEEARWAKDEANAQALQSAFERSLMVCPDILTNNSVETFAKGVFRKGLIRAPLIPEQANRIKIQRGTSIIGRNARFVPAP